MVLNQRGEAGNNPSTGLLSYPGAASGSKGLGVMCSYPDL